MNRAVEKYVLAASVPKFQNICGVYFLILRGDIIYIGQSTNCPNRIDEHKRRGIEFDSITFFECEKSELREREKYYIRELLPAMNTIKFTNTRRLWKSTDRIPPAAVPEAQRTPGLSAASVELYGTTLRPVRANGKPVEGPDGCTTSTSRIGGDA